MDLQLLNGRFSKNEVTELLHKMVQVKIDFHEQKIKNSDSEEDNSSKLSLIDKESSQVISREKFIGQKGENVKKIYTNSIESQYLYLLLEDVTKNQIGKTTIIIK